MVEDSKVDFDVFEVKKKLLKSESIIVNAVHFWKFLHFWKKNRDSAKNDELVGDELVGNACISNRVQNPWSGGAGFERSVVGRSGADRLRRIVNPDVFIFL